MLNRGKQSVTVQLKDPAGVEIIRDLIRCSDVLVENFRPGVMARLGLDYPSVRTLRPKLIYASITGFGAEGQFAQLPAFDLVIQAMSGLMSITGERDGRPNAVGESLADVCTGMFAAWGITAALFERERTGVGQHLDVSMLDSVFSMLLTGLGRELHTTRPAERVGNRHPETYPVDSFRSGHGFEVSRGDIGGAGVDGLRWQEQEGADRATHAGRGGGGTAGAGCRPCRDAATGGGRCGGRGRAQGDPVL